MVLGLPLGLLSMQMDTGLCNSMDIYPHTLGSCDKAGKEMLGAQGAAVFSLHSSRIETKTSKAKLQGNDSGISHSGLCPPGHQSGDPVIPLDPGIPLCHLPHTGMGEREGRGSCAQLNLICVASPG